MTTRLGGNTFKDTVGDVAEETVEAVGNTGAALLNNLLRAPSW